MLLAVQRIIIFMVLMNVILQLTNLENYGKYLRFVTGCLLAIYILTPIAEFVAGDGREALMEEWFTAGEELGEIGEEPEELLAYYVANAERQLLGVLRTSGYSAVGVRVALSFSETVATVEEVTVILTTASDAEGVKNYLINVYNLQREHIHITVTEDGNE